MLCPSAAMTYIGILTYGSPKLLLSQGLLLLQIFTFIAITLTAKHLAAVFPVVYASFFMTSKKPTFPPINWQS